jgi:serine/threonine protein kinase/tetratricopeptide (TPR) repeat protein
MNTPDPSEVTQDLQSRPQDRTAEARHPQRIGRYRIERVLGKGGFGLVYLAHDETLDRPVAVKVPHARLLSHPEDAKLYLAEARTVASLEHPSIVPVHDVGSSDEFPCFVVSRFVLGSDLATHLKQKRLSYSESAGMVATIAEALHYAHKRGIVHRDVKPGNILIDADGKPFIVDFGLALREESVGTGARHVGTPAYMSPEQARGEGHRVDGRSDIFSLGILFYEMLAGRRPFRADTKVELFDQIQTLEPRPLTQYDERIPRELQRICFKALSKRASERFSSAREMAEDLRHFLDSPENLSTTDNAKQTTGSAEMAAPATPTQRDSAKATTPCSDSDQPNSGGQIIKIVPKGLRSFDAHDADFFLELLPGPRDREGLPDSLRFWKTNIEETDPDNTFSVGLIYGPSGCGKSSLVKAGLLPRLSEHVISIYIEATPEETETRLLHGLRKRCAALDDNLSLKETMAALRRGQGIPFGRKVLIVLDQFEQWLHARKEEENSNLVQALRQCDGERVQCIIMVRDDFWLAVTRFMGELEVDLLQGRNTALADLFGLPHAEKVLAAFGRAFGTLPDRIGETTKEQREFLKQAVAGLAEEGKVICVRLALFAEMMKGKSWTPATLKEVGGAKGVGITFLEETFSSHAAHPKHRLHQKAARAVLKDLLPDSGADIKGKMRSYTELLEASGYGNRPQDFDDLIRILDSEIRLITPTDPEGKEADRDSVTQTLAGQKYFQLTHDYLVHSLRDWLTRKQKETRRGRAELKLFDMSVTWTSRPENRFLPSLMEWFSIRALTDSKHWTESQQEMMRKAVRVQGTRWGGLLLTLLTIAVSIRFWASAQHWKNLQEQTTTAVTAMQNNLGPSVPYNLEKLRTLPEQLVVPQLQTRFSTTKNPRHKLSLAFALAGCGHLDAEYLTLRIDDIAEEDTGNYVMAMRANPETALAALKAEAFKCVDKPLWRRKAKLSIVALGLSDTELAIDMCTFENRRDPEQRTLFLDEFPHWKIDLDAVLAAVKHCDRPALRSGICLAVGQLPAEQIGDSDKASWTMLASNWYAEIGDTSTHSAAGWLLRQWKAALPEISNPHEILPQRDWYVVKTNGATMLRIRSSASFVSGIPNPAEKHQQWLTDLEKVVVATELERPGVRERRAIAFFHVGKLSEALDDLNRVTKDTPPERQPTIQQYLTLTLARLGKANEARTSLARYLELNIPESYKCSLRIQVLAWLGDTTEALRQLESAVDAASTDQDFLYNLASATALCAQATAERDPDDSKQFRHQAFELLQKLYDLGYLNAEFLSRDPSFACLHSDTRFVSILSAMKSPPEFWISDREVTRGQFEEFINDASYAAAEKPAEWNGPYTTYSPTADHPAQQVSWYDALLYCNWLSHREGLQQRYERTSMNGNLGNAGQGYDAWRVVPDATGYRLLHEAEWENACRAGATTLFSSGDDEGLLTAYCQMPPSKLTAECGEKLPNAWGLHDMHGNVREWCWDKDVDSFYRTFRAVRGGTFFDLAVLRSAARVAYQPETRIDGTGFRVGRTLPTVPFPAFPRVENEEKLKN